MASLLTELTALKDRWRQRKVADLSSAMDAQTVEALGQSILEETPRGQDPLFENPFQLRDVLVFDDETLCELLETGEVGVSVEELAWALRGGPPRLLDRVECCLPPRDLAHFVFALEHPAPLAAVADARRRLLDALFWELTYWKTPELYEDLTEGEALHPDIFRRLAPLLRGRLVLDAGAGSGRATFEALRYGARCVYAVEPSPGLLRLLEGKMAGGQVRRQIVPLRGRFDALPLDDDSVDVTLSCSAFSAEPGQGGEAGLAELRRVTRPGGRIVLIWPHPEDLGWLARHGFAYEALPVAPVMGVHFKSVEAALRCARRFYARNPRVLHYLLRTRHPVVPFSVLGFNPPHDYCMLTVEK